MKKDFLAECTRWKILFFEIIKFYMIGFISYIEWIVKEGEIDGDE